MPNRDLGIRGTGAGKGDADRTDDVKKFQKNLKRIGFNPQDKTGFKEVKPGRFRKTYGKTEAEVKGHPVPESLMPAARAARSAIGGCSEI